MIHLTREEKASRYDSLQIAMKHTLEHYKKERKDAEKKYNNDSFGVIGAYEKGVADGMGLLLDNIARWVE